MIMLKYCNGVIITIVWGDDGLITFDVRGDCVIMLKYCNGVIITTCLGYLRVNLITT